MPADEKHFLSFKGIRVFYRMILPEGEILSRALILSSPLTQTFHFRKLVPELTQSGCCAVLVDLPGFGRSDCRGLIPQDALTRANILWGILDSVDEDTNAPQSTWHLIAHGTACPAIVEMARLYPDSVRSQVHICPVFRLPEKTDGEQWFAKNVLREGAFRKKIGELAAYPLDDFILSRMREPLLRPGADSCFRHMVRVSRKGMQPAEDFCPKMVLSGGLDPLLTDDETLDILLPEAEKHLLVSAGHFPMETHSKALRDYLRGWFKYIQ